MPEKLRIDGKYPVVGSNGVVGFHNEAMIKRNQSIVIGRKGSSGKVNWINSPCTPIDTTFYICENSELVILLYLYHSLKSIENKLINLSMGIGSPGLNRNNAYHLTVPVPSIEKQTEILAEIAEYEAQIAACEQKIQSLPAQKQAILAKYLQ